ncbi:MAG TPA: tripartite tricarboxylate transporter substrate binding protein [Pseudolabrys sp.]|nr:tripartite tricarboxylate transporter substrate binding protein [Pseudolabrys sp.]
MPKGFSFFTLCLLSCTSIFVAPLNVRADDLPSGPIRIIVGFGASSSADTVARLVAKYMTDRIGQPVIVENRPGNSSMIAAEYVARAPNDGRTLFMATVANTLYPASVKSSFNLGKDLQPIALLAVVPNVLVAHPSLNVRTVHDLVELAKSKSETLSFGTSGQWTASHMAAQLFNMEAGTKVTTVPYQGGANQGVPDLLAGRINLMFNVAATLAPHVKEGKLVALAVGQPKRTVAMPDVPTMAEAGMPDFDVGIWIGLLAPANTPPNIIDNLSKLSNEGVHSPEAEKTLNTQSIDVLGGTPAEFSKFIEKDNEKWARIIAAIGPQ